MENQLTPTERVLAKLPVPSPTTCSICRYVPSVKLSTDEWRNYISHMAAAYRRKGLIV